MKKNISATSIIEALVVMMVIVMGVTGAYQMFNQSIKVVDSSEFKLTAISMAKEGMEAMNNIRDTNWIIFKGDLANCWNSLNYDIGCLNDNSTDHLIGAGKYKIFIGPQYRWNLAKYNGSGDYSDTTFRDFFKVGLDTNGFYTQSGATQEIKPIFTREIEISYLEDGITSGDQGEKEQKMQVISRIQWVDPSSSEIKQVELKNILTNWLNKN